MLFLWGEWLKAFVYMLKKFPVFTQAFKNLCYPINYYHVWDSPASEAQRVPNPRLEVKKGPKALSGSSCSADIQKVLLSAVRRTIKKSCAAQCWAGRQILKAL